MKQTLKKSLALILALALLLALPMQAFAAPIRETDYFPEKNHTDQPYSEIVFTQPDLEGAQTIIAAIEPLLDDAANIGHGGRRVEELDGVCSHGLTMVTVSYLDFVKDPASSEIRERYLTASEKLRQMNALANQLIVKMDGSPCREVLLDYMTEATIQRMVQDAAADGPRGQELKQEISQMQSQYTTLLAQAPSDGLTQEIGELYLELVNANNELARLKGYENYQDYAYKSNARDYTPEDVARLRQDIKKYFAPYTISYSILNTLATLQESGIGEIDAVSPQVQEKIEGFLGSVSSELLESYHFMWDKGYCDFEEVGPGDQRAFVTYLNELDVPFMRINHAGKGSANADALWKLRCFIHESGHYNANYQLPQNIWDGSSSALDVQETHSTGLEALFASRAGEVVGEENADFVLQEYLGDKILTLIVDQATYDELEEYAYTTPNLTVEDLTRKYLQIREEYGYPEGMDKGTEWMRVTPLFENPFYVISYTTSSLATLRLWLDSQEDYDGAVEKYLTFVSQGMDTSLRKALSSSGMADPFREGAMKELMDSVNKEFGLEKRLTEKLGYPFIDVVSLTDLWYEDAVKYVYQQGLMTGTSGMTFSPNGTFDRGMLATTLWRQAGSPDIGDENWGYPYQDVDMGAYYGTAVYWARLEGIASGVGGNRFAPSDPVTRQDFVTMLWRQAGKPKVDLSVLKRFSDEGQISDYAREAMAWAVESRIISGRGNGILAPKSSTTRAEAAQIFMNAGSAHTEAAALDDAA